MRAPLLFVVAISSLSLRSICIHFFRLSRIRVTRILESSLLSLNNSHQNLRFFLECALLQKHSSLINSRDRNFALRRSTHVFKDLFNSKFIQDDVDEELDVRKSCQNRREKLIATSYERFEQKNVKSTFSSSKRTIR